METGSRLKGIAVPSHLSINLSSNQNKLSIKKIIVAAGINHCGLSLLLVKILGPRQKATG